MAAEIEVTDLRRIYRSPTGPLGRRVREICALDGVTFEVQGGELFGLLGPNAAGKTTLTKILATILLPTSGTARIRGFDVAAQAERCRPFIGIVFGGERGLYGRLSGRSNLEYFAALYHVDPRVARRRIPELLQVVGLTDRADERVENYSRGMRQRLHIARALVHDPAVVIMDEPTIGLDPAAARELRRIIKSLCLQGKTVFLTTHYMYEADELCRRVAVVHRGKILICDTPSALKNIVRDLEVVEIELFGAPDEVIARIRALPSVKAAVVQRQDHAQILQIQSQTGSAIIPQLLLCLNGVHVGKILTRQPTLEDAYLKLVGSEGYVV